MKFTLRHTAGALLLLLLLLRGVASARADDCSATLHDPEFRCRAKNVVSYCTSVSSADDDTAATAEASGGLYRQAYCGLKTLDDTAVVERVAQSLGYPDPELAKILLQYPLRNDLNAWLAQHKLTFESLPKDIQTAYATGEQLPLLNYFSNLQSVYQNEMALERMKGELKTAYKGSERWYNGTHGLLADSPFDLSDDLDAINYVLFGVHPIPNEDVFSWPGAEESTGATPGPLGPAPGTSSSGSAATSSSTITQNGCPPGQEPMPPAPQSEPPSATTPGGEPLICPLDPELINFKNYTAPAPSPGGTPTPTPAPTPAPTECRPSTTTIPGATEQKGQPSPPGTLKTYPDFRKPVCPQGFTEWKFEVRLPGNTITRSSCVENSFCKNYDDFRGLIRPVLEKRFKNNPELAEAIANALEVSACASYELTNRPQSAYAPEESCIDCHITAIGERFYKMLQKNIAPLQNPTNAFGPTNRWGPRFYFNIVTALKGKRLPQSWGKPPEYAVIKNLADRIKKDQNQSLDPYKTVEPRAGDPTAEEKQQAFQRRFALEMSFVEGAVDRDTERRIKSLLDQWRESFSRINGMIQSAAANDLLNKETCRC